MGRPPNVGRARLTAVLDAKSGRLLDLMSAEFGGRPARSAVICRAIRLLYATTFGAQGTPVPAAKVPEKNT